MTMDLILEKIAASPPGREIGLLRQLVDSLRPAEADDVEGATRNVRALAYLLERNPDLAAGLRNYISCIFSSRKLAHLCADVGILENQGFWAELWQRLNHKWLPPTLNDDYLRDVFCQLFAHTDDWIWVSGVSDETWHGLLRALGFHRRADRPLIEGILREMLEAAQVLSYRISAIGLEPELVRNHPDIERFESPFLRQNVELMNFVTSFHLWFQDRQHKREDAQQIEVLLDQCEGIIERIHRQSAHNGVSISLTRLLLRLQQSIFRLRTLLSLIEPTSIRKAQEIGIAFFKTLVKADNAKHSIGDVFQTNTELLARQVTERAGRAGEHYVTRTLEEWREMLRSASGAGFIVGFMALLKVLASKLVLAPFGYAFVYSLNYSLGFMVVHVLHFTIATKQPAMTAAAIAASIDQGKQKLNELSELVVCVLRSQLIAIIGNVAVAMPTAYAIAWAWFALHGKHLADADKVQHLLHELDPIHSLALPHAAIAGVCLFLSGLISGYYDNKAAYNDIPARLRQLPWLQRLLGPQRLDRVTVYLGNNLGALAGNFFFGIMLGTIGTLGFIFGLPIDIRHITFSSANFAFALVGADHGLSWQQWAVSLGGIALIGLTNLGVSFSLALGVALRSRGVSFSQGGELLLVLLRRFRTGPRDFFLPPREPLSRPN